MVMTMKNLWNNVKKEHVIMAIQKFERAYELTKDSFCPQKSVTREQRQESSQARTEIFPQRSPRLRGTSSLCPL